MVIPDADVDADLLRRASATLETVVDPELGVDVVSLGLVYGLDVRGRDVHVRITTTSPACPLGEVMIDAITTALRALDGVGAVDVELVWEPPWAPERMSPEARAALGWPG